MEKSFSKKESDRNDVDINEMVKPYLKKWKWIVLGILVCVAYGYYLLKKSSEVYNIQSTVLIKDARKAPSMEMGALSQLGGFGNTGANSVENEMEILKSKKLMADVVEELGLQVNLLEKEGLRKNILYGKQSPVLIKVVNEKVAPKTFKGPVKMKIYGDKLEFFYDDLPNPIVSTYSKTVSLPYANLIFLKNPDFVAPKDRKLGNLEIAYMPKEDAVDTYQNMTNVRLVDKDGTVVSLSMNYPNIQKAKDIIDKLVQVYNNDAIIDKSVESKKTRDFIDERVGIIANELGAVEAQKEQFKVDNKIIDILTEAQVSYGGSEQAKNRLLENETQLALATDLLNYVNKLGNDQTMPVSVGMGNPLAAVSINSYNELVLQRNRLLESATPQNPVIVDLNKQIQVMRASVADAIQKQRASLQAIVQQVEGQKNAFSARVGKIPAQEKLFRSIERQQQIKESLYLLLLQKREEAAISLAITSPKARIIDYAYSSSKPVAPKRTVILGGAFLLGLFIPLGLIYVKELFNNKVRSKDDLQKHSLAPILGEIPSLSRGANEIVEMHDLSPMAEAFRILSTNIAYMLPKKNGGKVIFVTSTTKGEGKTFVSLNLALTMATNKIKVLIIGADIRNPQLQRYNPSRKGISGLSEFLHDDTSTPEQYIHPSTFNPNLDMLYSGSIPPNPTELLSNGRYELLINTLREKYDYIVVDTAPLMLVTDTFLTSELADATVYVVRSGYTENSLIEFANHQMEEGKINNPGFVLNDVNREYFGYGNKYGYGYNKEEPGFFNRLKDRLRL
ncbi:GumC family protein [Chryseobacterium koreense]